MRVKLCSPSLLEPLEYLVKNAIPSHISVDVVAYAIVASKLTSEASWQLTTTVCGPFPRLHDSHGRSYVVALDKKR